MAAPRIKAWIGGVLPVAGLWTLAVAQPLLDVLGRAPEFFVVHDFDAIDLAALASQLVLAGPVVLAALLGLGAAIGPRAAARLTAGLVGLLSAVLAIQAGYRAGIESWSATAGLAAAAGAAAGLLWVHIPFIRAMVLVMGAAVLIVPGTFLMSDAGRALLRAGAPAAAVLDAGHQVPVVLVVFDELPLTTLMDGSGRIAAAPYPNFASLAADGIWYRNATAVSDYTRWALPAIITGRFPKPGTVPTPGDHPNSLFTALGESHEVHAREALTALCPAALSGRTRQPFVRRQAAALADVRVLAAHLFLPPAGRIGLPDLTQDWGRFGQDDVSGFKRIWRDADADDPRTEAYTFIDGISADAARPPFYFLHTLVSHHPPRWLPSGQAVADYAEPPAIVKMGWVEDSWPVAQYQQGHLLQASLADRVIGRLRDRLVQTGLYDRALVIVVADHGLSFLPGSRVRDFTPRTAGEILPVPFIVKLPAGMGPGRGVIDDRNVETIDIAPLIADVLGITLPWPVDGRSPLSPGTDRPEKRIAYRGAREVATFAPAAVAAMRDRIVARKEQMFGTAAWPSPTPDGLAVLSGRRLDSLEIRPPERAEARLDAPFAFDHVDVAAAALPVQVKGSIADRGSSAPDTTHVALAVNGELVATTRTWHATRRWMAMIPPDRLRNGRNDVQAFVVDPAQPGRLFGRPTDLRVAAGENLLFGSQARRLAIYEGFYREERAGDTRFHWTDGAAAIRVPVDPTRPFKALTIRILFTGRDQAHLGVRLNDCVLVTETLSAGPWEKTIPLDGCPLSGRWATIRLDSDTQKPSAGDNRRLGVALAEVSWR